MAVGEVVPKQNGVSAKDMRREIASGRIALAVIFKTIRGASNLEEPLPDARANADRQALKKLDGFAVE